MLNPVYNNGTYFFDISSDNLASSALAKIGNDALKAGTINSQINRNVISFSITEELGRMTTGTLVLSDDGDLYSAIFVNGAHFTISFGYRSFNAFAGAFATSFRKNIKCVVSNPSGAGDNSGAKILTITFYSFDVIDRKQFRSFTAEGNRAGVVSKLMQESGCLKYTIDFEGSDKPISEEEHLRQFEGNFAMLNRLANEWGCLFWISADAAGNKLGSFISPKKINTVGLQHLHQIVPGLEELDLYYNSGQNSNVIAFDWQQHIGESGEGDQVQIRYDFKGQPIFERTVAEGEKFVTYTLSPDKISKALGKHQTAGDYNAFVADLLSQPTFNDKVKSYFTRVESETAPQGMGFTINVQMVGDPFIMPYRPVVFKGGFPSALGTHSGLVTFWVLKATHTITKSGYMTNIEIVDSYTMAGSYLQIGAALNTGV